MSRSETFWMLSTGLFCGVVAAIFQPPFWVAFIGSVITGAFSALICERVTR